MGNLDDFSKLNVLVFGDVMLDRYWWGKVNRISPEAPVPVVRLDTTSNIAGGAANVAANIAGLGANPILIGVIGNDEGGETFKETLEVSSISPDNLVVLDDRPTTVKTRIVAHSQQIVRLDQETTAELSLPSESIVRTKLEELLPNVDIIVISDYAKGVLNANLLDFVISHGRRAGVKVLVDPKGKNYAKYRGATLLTPNRKEAAEACKLEENGQLLVETAGAQLLDETETDAILITQGEDGVTLFEQNRPPVHLEAMTRNVYDVTGAGDTFIATVAASLGAGNSLEEAARLANIAAGIVVEQVGTTAISKHDLAEASHRLAAGGE